MSDPNIKDLSLAEAAEAVHLRGILDELREKGPTLGRLLSAEEVWNFWIESNDICKSFFGSPHRTQTLNPEIIVGETRTAGKASEIGTVESRTIPYARFYKENDPILTDLFSALNEMGVHLKRTTQKAFIPRAKLLTNMIRSFVSGKEVQNLTSTTSQGEPLRGIPNPGPMRKQVHDLSYALRKARQLRDQVTQKPHGQNTRRKKKY